TTGGSRVEGEGTFFEATVLTDVREGSELLREEIFGPVLAIVPFDTEEEAVRLANGTEFGLVFYGFTTDLARGQRLIELLESGLLWLKFGVVSNAAASFGGWKRWGRSRGHPRVPRDELHAHAEPVLTPRPGPGRRRGGHPGPVGMATGNLSPT